MLKINHPGAIVRDRDKQVSSWEGVRLYKYANGVECQLLIGHLPHGHAQAAISANRPIKLTIDGTTMVDAVAKWWRGSAAVPAAQNTYLPCILREPARCNPTCPVKFVMSH